MVFKTLVGTVIVASLAASVPLEPASARNGRNAALVGGLLAGALVGAAVADGERHYRPRYYYGYEPAYGYPYPYYAPPPRYPYPRPGYCGYPPDPPCY